MRPPVIPAVLLAVSLLLMPLPAARGADHPAPVLPPLKPFDAQLWSDLMAHSAELSCLHRLAIDDKLVIAAIASWKAEFPQGITVCKGRMRAALAGCPWAVGNGSWYTLTDSDPLQDATLERYNNDGDNRPLLLSRMTVPVSSLAPLNIIFLAGFTMQDPLDDPIDWDASNMTLPEVIAQLCTAAGIDYVTRRDVSTPPMVTMHLTGKSRRTCIDLAAEACGWISVVKNEMDPRLVQSGFIDVDAGVRWKVDLVQRWQNPESDEARQALLADPLQNLHAGLVSLRKQQHDRVVTVLPPIPPPVK